MRIEKIKYLRKSWLENIVLFCLKTIKAIYRLCENKGNSGADTGKK